MSSAFAQFSIDNYALCHLNIVDVNAKRILEDYTIVIQNGKIQNILPSKDYIPNDSVQSIVLRNKFVVPGLIDAHVHFVTNPTEERRDNAEKVLKAMLLTGVTSVRDMAGDARALASLSRDALVGDIVAPNIYYSSLMAGTSFFTDPRTIEAAQGGVSGKMSYSSLEFGNQIIHIFKHLIPSLLICLVYRPFPCLPCLSPKPFLICW